MMDDLIEAFKIFKKYSNDKYPTRCEHDIMRVYVSPDDVTKEDKITLEKLGFNEEPEYDCFYSFKFGSA